MNIAILLLVAGILAQTPASPAVPPAQGPQDVEVFLAPLKASRGQITVGQPQNISNSPGYDNQPSFSPDGTSVFFTSSRGEIPAGATSAPMDIYRYDLASKQVIVVTKTPEGEYSPTVMPGGKRLSVIRVEADGTQRLWSFTMAGQDPSLVLTDIKPVGYHAWLDANTLALFVLGAQRQPSTLQIADVRTGTAQVAATDIGRTLQRIPGGGVSFVQRGGEGAQRTLTISEVVVKSGTPVTRVLTNAAPGATDEFITWTPDGTLLMAAGGKLHAWRRGGAWKVIADLDTSGLKSVSRLAVSPEGNWLALVAEKK